jgi:predicted Zn-dependent protease
VGWSLGGALVAGLAVAAGPEGALPSAEEPAWKEAPEGQAPTAAPRPDARPGPDGGGGGGGVKLRVRKGDDMEAVMAEARLKSGRPLMAADMARQCLARRPDAIACRRVMLRALAGAGLCAEALPGLEALRSEGEWSADLALAEGLCRLRVGDPATAREAFLEAARMKDKEPLYRYEAAMASVRRAEFDGFDDLIGELEDSNQPWMADALGAWRAVERGDADVDGRLAWVGALGEAEGMALPAQVAMMNCRRWLDLGDPVAADAVAKRGVKASMQQTRLLGCRAEALRRQGWAAEALELVMRPWNEAADTPALDAVRVRALVDLGRMGEAAEAVAKLSRSEDPDLIAARWYFARAAGGPDAPRWAARYVAWPAPAGRGLETYTPIGAGGRP